MCLILNSAIESGSDQEPDNSVYMRVAQRVLQSSVHRYYDCSARYTEINCFHIRFSRYSKI